MVEEAGCVIGNSLDANALLAAYPLKNTLLWRERSLSAHSIYLPLGFTQ